MRASRRPWVIDWVVLGLMISSFTGCWSAILSFLLVGEEDGREKDKSYRALADSAVWRLPLSRVPDLCPGRWAFE
jgi:hypothetical protein